MKRKKPDLVSREEVLRIIDAARIPLVGYENPDMSDRSYFAAFNLGRLQEHIHRQVRELKPAR